MRTIQERQEILEIAGRENEPRCYLQIDNEIRWFNANIFRKNHAKYFRPMESWPYRLQAYNNIEYIMKSGIRYPDLV